LLRPRRLPLFWALLRFLQENLHNRVVFALFWLPRSLWIQAYHNSEWQISYQVCSHLVYKVDYDLQTTWNVPQQDHYKWLIAWFSILFYSI
jgi:hypothetical protein